MFFHGENNPEGLICSFFPTLIALIYVYFFKINWLTVYNPSFSIILSSNIPSNNDFPKGVSKFGLYVLCLN